MEQIKWQQWEEATFEKARREDKALFLWIEYFGCRACRRMEREGLRGPAAIELINERFIPIKVSREEHPDIDKHFQRVFTTMTGRDEGWPLSIYIDPDKVPLYAASYIPAEASDGMMSLYQIAELIAKRYAKDRETLLSKGRDVLDRLKPKLSIEATRIDREILRDRFVRQIKEVYDSQNKGFGEGRKYLHASATLTALDCCNFDNKYELTGIVTEVLDTMLSSPVWDSRYGGFFCCSLDDSWSVPLRRKDLSENALMVLVLLKAEDIKNESRYAEAAYKIGEWALGKMKDTGTGLFYNANDSESTDRRVFASSNAMMIKALLELSRRNDRFHVDALAAVNTLMLRMVSGADIRHQLDNDNTVTYLTDYATVADMLLSAAKVSDNNNYLLDAAETANAAIRRFYDKGFWSVGDGQFADPCGFADSALPSPAAVIVSVLARLSKEIDKAYEPFVRQTFEVSSYELMRKPISKAKMVDAVLKYYND